MSIPLLYLADMETTHPLELLLVLVEFNWFQAMERLHTCIHYETDER